ncbi:MAG: UDP-3-O-(3-hydroxymyristoyl)glucosamine N-acyltransferase, partial [Halothermotrichaceae bacterium]
MGNKQTEYTASSIADYVGGTLIGDADLVIKGVAGAAECGSSQLTFAENERYIKKAEKSEAAVILVPPDIKESNKTIISVDNPRLSYSKAAMLFTSDTYNKKGISSQAVVAETAVIGEGSSIYPRAVIDENVEIGKDVIIGPGVYVGKQTQIGDNTLIHPNTVIENDSIIGKNVIINSGTVIGSDGYGFVTDEKGHHKIPQLGNVIIEDNVEIGANVTVDRGASGPTIIGEGTKIDNLVQIAHNVRIGSKCLIVAQVGIAGSSQLGSWVTLAGKTGVAGHIKIEDNATIAAGSVVTKDTPGGVFYSGNPAHEHRDELKEQAARRKLPELVKKIKQLEKK